MRKLCAVVFLAAFAVSAAAEAAERKRSVIIIIIDSLRRDHLQTYGYGRDTSPNILAFSRSATVFEKAYPAGAWTRPSILSLMTGHYSAELTASPFGGAPMSDAQPTLAKTFRANGYRTIGIHNTGQLTKEASNLQRGFDTYIDYGDKRPGHLGDGRVPEGVNTALAQLAAAQQPVFMMFHILDPHIPYEPRVNRYGKAPVHKYHDPYRFVYPSNSEDIMRNFRMLSCNIPTDTRLIPDFIDLYDSEIHEMDAELARLFAFIERDPRYRDAVVVLTADHGEEFGEHGGVYHGTDMVEEQLRVPLIVRDPARPVSRGRRFDQIVSLIDVAPTLLDAVGISYEAKEYSGRTLKPFFGRRGAEVRRDTAITERISCGSWRTAIHMGDWKMVDMPWGNRVLLYNLKEDPMERHSLTDSQRDDAEEALARLGSTLDAWRARVMRPIPTRDGGDGSVAISPELSKRLKALGYLQ